MWNLEEAADVDFVMCVHEDHVLKQPEERPGVVFFGLQQLEDAVVLKEQPASALYWREGWITARGFGIWTWLFPKLIHFKILNNQFL